MRIGQLAQLTGADIQTIRFYERQGLLASPNRQANGYRAYEADHVEKLLFILPVCHLSAAIMPRSSSTGG